MFQRAHIVNISIMYRYIYSITAFSHSAQRQAINYIIDTYFPYLCYLCVEYGRAHHITDAIQTLKLPAMVSNWPRAWHHAAFRMMGGIEKCRDGSLPGGGF
jgi:hypothetical protein